MEVLRDLTAGDVLSALEVFPKQAVKSRALSGNGVADRNNKTAEALHDALNIF